MEEMTFEQLQKIAGSMWLRKTLVAAVELEVFSKISKGINTVERIVEDLKVGGKGVERLLNALVAIGLLRKEGEIYGNLDVSEKYLVKEKPEYYGDFIIMIDKSTEKWGLLKESILQGSPVENELTNFEDPVFTKAMHNNAQEPAKVLSEKLDLSSYRSLLDLGGGSGVYSIVLTNKNPGLKATVFELPGVCETAKEYIKELGDEKRINTYAGDMLKDKLPEGFDVVLLSHILHSHSIEDCKKIIKKVYDLIPENGLVVVNEFVLNEEKTGPLFPALFNVNMFLSSKEGSSYTEKEILSWLEEAGFKGIEVFPLAMPVTCIIGKK
jgi:predicted nicotinamide N-methyase